MSFFSKLIGVGVAETLEAAAKPVDAVGNAFDKLFTSDEERAQGEFVLEKMRQQPHILQAEINKIEAQHRTIFVAGARPFILWICGFGLGYVWVVRPIIIDIATFLGKTVTFTHIDTSNMIHLVLALLGLGGLRTFEKMKGLTK